MMFAVPIETVATELGRTVPELQDVIRSAGYIPGEVVGPAIYDLLMEHFADEAAATAIQVDPPAVVKCQL